MKAVVGSAVTLGGLEPVVEFEKLTGLHIAGIDSRRPMADSGDLVPNTDRLQRLDRLWAGIDCSSDLAQRWSRFKNLGGQSDSLQRIRGRESGEPAADNGYPTG